MIPAIFNIPDHYKGDTFEAIPFVIREEGVPVDLTNAIIKISFKKDKINGSLIQTFTNGSGITITNAAIGSFLLDEFINDWQAKKYFYDTQVTFTNSTPHKVRTYFKGTLVVTQDTTDG
jgi:hypothetical protein